MVVPIIGMALVNRASLMRPLGDLAALGCVNLFARGVRRMLDLVRLAPHDNPFGGKRNAMDMAIRQIFSVSFAGLEVLSWQGQPPRGFVPGDQKSLRYHLGGHSRRGAR